MNDTDEMMVQIRLADLKRLKDLADFYEVISQERDELRKKNEELSKRNKSLEEATKDMAI